MRIGLGISVPGRHARRSSLPILSSVSIGFGSTYGDTIDRVLIGANLDSVVAVKFGGADASYFTVDSTNQITVRAPALEPGSYDITAISPAGVSAPLSQAYEAIPILLWRESGDDSTFNGDRVAAEVDHSGLANNPEQPTALNQPLYVASSETFNHKPSVAFDGVDEYMSTPPIDLMGGYVAFQLARFVALQDSNGLWHTSDSVSDGPNGHGSYVTADGRIEVQSGGGAGGGECDVSVSAGVNYLFTQSQYEDRVSVRLNGINLHIAGNDSAPLPNTTAPFPVNIGTGWNSIHSRTNGEHPATIVVAGSLTAAQISAVEAYLNAKYAVY